LEYPIDNIFCLFDTSFWVSSIIKNVINSHLMEKANRSANSAIIQGFVGSEI